MTRPRRGSSRRLWQTRGLALAPTVVRHRHRR